MGIHCTREGGGRKLKVEGEIGEKNITQRHRGTQRDRERVEERRKSGTEKRDSPERRAIPRGYLNH
jgi:hypothetical protein